MTEHILNFSIGLDDEGIREAVQKKAENEILKEIKVDILNAIFRTSTYRVEAAKINYNGEIEISRDAELTMFTKDLIKETLEENKDAIIKMAAENLAESFKRTKNWKNATAEVMEDN